MLFGILFIGYSLTFPPPQAKMVGIFAGSLMTVLGIIQFSIEIRRASKSDERPKPEQVREFWRRSGMLACWIGGFSILTYLFGFLISTPLFITAYLKTHNTGWLATFIVAVVTTGLIYGLFEFFLERELWRGLLL